MILKYNKRNQKHENEQKAGFIFERTLYQFEKLEEIYDSLSDKVNLLMSFAGITLVLYLPKFSEKGFIQGSNFYLSLLHFSGLIFLVALVALLMCTQLREFKQAGSIEYLRSSKVESMDLTMLKKQLASNYRSKWSNNYNAVKSANNFFRWAVLFLVEAIFVIVAGFLINV